MRLRGGHGRAATCDLNGPVVLVIGMVEQGLDGAMQEALIAHLRCRGPVGRPLFLLRRRAAASVGGL